MRADTMVLYMLCTLTDTYTVVHLKDGKYWTTLRDEPTEHNVYLERCNTHLCYLGNSKFVELELRLKPYEFEIFGTDQPVKVELETTLITVGSLSVDEAKTINILLDHGLDKPKEKSMPSASPGSHMDLPHLNFELKTEPPEHTKTVTASNLPNPDTKEPMIPIPSTESADASTATASNPTEQTMRQVDQLSCTGMASEFMSTQNESTSTLEKASPVVCIEKISVPSNTMLLSAKKPSTKPKVKLMLKIQKMTTADIECVKNP